jgi:PAS domain S-box-containing protein
MDNHMNDPKNKKIYQNTNHTHSLSDIETELRLIIDNIPSLVAYIDTSIKYRLVNQSYQNFFGISGTEVIGKHVREGVGADVYEILKKHIDIVLTGKKTSYEEHYKNKNGNIRILSANLIPYIDAKGTQSGYLVIIDDITEQRNLQIQIENLNSSLENKVISRTNQLQKRTAKLNQEINERKKAEEALQKAHEKLERRVVERTRDYRRAKEEAEQANKLKSEFLANMSHELRTPMHGILSFSKFGIDKIEKASKEKNLKYFKTISKSGIRLMNLLNDLLDLSKLEAGKEVYKMELINIKKMAKDVVSEMGSIWKEKNLNVKIENSTMPPKIICDNSKIEQVILNLLSNAMKFTPEDKQVTISLSSSELPLGQRSSDMEMISAMTVSVSDEGVGIPEIELESVFDKFIQSTKTKTGAGGTGLGLTICKEIINGHNGKIWAENNPEEGSTFSFMLPYEQETVPE